MKLKITKLFSTILAITLATTLLLTSNCLTVKAAEYNTPLELSATNELTNDVGLSYISDTTELEEISPDIQENIITHETQELEETVNETVNDTVNDEIPLLTNDSVTQGYLSKASEFSWYLFSLNAKSHVSILLQMVTSLDADLYVFQEDTNGELVLVAGSSTEGAGTQEFMSEVFEQGLYYMAVASYEGNGNFAFAYYESDMDADNEINDSTDTATVANFNATCEGVIDNPFDYDYYSITVSKPTIMRYTVSSSNSYAVGYAGSNNGINPTVIDGTLIKIQPGTYYFAVYSPTQLYSSESTYTLNFKKIGEYADESIAPLRAIDESAGIVFQTNVSGTNCFVNGHPIDISYKYSFSSSNSGGYQSYNITLNNLEGVRCQIWNEETQGPDVVYYHSSTRPAKSVGSKYLLRLMFYANSDVKFYRIMCRATGAYSANNLFVDPSYVIVLIDPDDGKLVDIAEYNYFYEFATGSNSITTSGRRDMTFSYNLYDYVD